MEVREERKKEGREEGRGKREKGWKARREGGKKEGILLRAFPDIVLKRMESHGHLSFKNSLEADYLAFTFYGERTREKEMKNSYRVYQPTESAMEFYILAR